MPLKAFSKARQERRLLVVLYIGALALLLILLYATWQNIVRYQRSTEAIRRHNSTIIELERVLASLKDQETGARGFMLTNDSVYLEPFRRSESAYLVPLSTLDSLYQGPDHVVLDSLRAVCDSLRAFTAGLILTNDPSLGLEPADAARLRRAKGAMDRARRIYERMLTVTRARREVLLSSEKHEGMKAPTMILVYAALALAATGLLFWRLFRSLSRNERMNLDLNLKILDLDKEVSARRKVQALLERVQDTSPNGIMSFSAVRDTEGSIIDFRWISSNRMANRSVGRDDLIGKRLLEEMPENGASGLFASYARCVELGQPFRRELHYTGEGMDRWVSVHAVKLDDGFMVTLSDISEQKRAQELNQEADRVALTGQITRTVAHEVRNPLTNIHLALEQLQDEVADRETATKPFFMIIQRNLERIGTLIREMLESSKKREPHPEPCGMDAIVNNVLKRVGDRLRLKEMRSNISVAPDLPGVLADPDLLDLAITNIAVNAVEAMEPGKGELRLSARWSGDEVLLEITDNGRGIPSENIGRLFEPFYSGRAGGLGLGLTTTRSILNSHGIALEVRSVVNRGTTFTLRFPPRIVVQYA